jgi:uncharacterized protein
MRIFTEYPLLEEKERSL